MSDSEHRQDRRPSQIPNLVIPPRRITKLFENVTGPEGIIGGGKLGSQDLMVPACMPRREFFLIRMIVQNLNIC